MDFVYKLFLGYIIGHILVALLAIAVAAIDKNKSKKN